MRKRVSKGVPAERTLAAAWDAARGARVTAGGETLHVVYPGRRNPGPGPDFVDAIIETETEIRRGAVEVHRRASDWERHGHSADVRYAGVVLHVVAEDDGVVSRLPGGARLPLLEVGALASGASPPLAVWRAFPCALAAARGADLLPALLVAGEARFRSAVTMLQADLQQTSPREWEAVAYRRVAAALGYSQNVAAMADLAASVPLQALRDLHGRSSGSRREPGHHSRSEQDQWSEAYLLGMAGLLPSQRHLPATRRHDPYVETLERLWRAESRLPALRAYRWDAARVRPENAPVRRVVALGHLALRWPVAGMIAAVRAALARPPAAANRQLAALVLVPCPDGYWQHHWDFGVPVRQRDGSAAALIGPARAADIVVNVLLPLATAVAAVTDDAALGNAARAAYAQHPRLAENWITRLVRERTGLTSAETAPGMPPVPADPPAVAGTSSATPSAAHSTSRSHRHRDPLPSAQAQQGLIAIYEGPCHALRCHECPLGRSGEPTKDE